MTSDKQAVSAASFDAGLPFGAQAVATPQLVLRPFGEEDVDALYAIMADAEAMRFTYVAPTREACVVRLRDYAAQGETLGYAPWTAVLREDGRVVGWGGLNVDPYDPGWGIEVAYCFDRSVWGRGLATEMVAAALEVGFGACDLAEIVAFVHPENVGSRRVLEKCGMRRKGYEPKLDRDHFVVRQEEWRENR